MNLEASFRYIFFDILNVIENLKINYRHEADMIPDFDGSAYFQWCLNVVLFSGHKTIDSFDVYFSNVVSKTTKNIKENRLELYSFCEYFSMEIEKHRFAFDELCNSKKDVSHLVQEGIITPLYLGFHNDNDYLDHDQIIKSDYESTSYNELYRICEEYFKVIALELSKLSLFLKHELNIASHQITNLEDKADKARFKDMISKGKTEELLKELSEIMPYKKYTDIMLLSNQFYRLENENRLSKISRENYNTEMNVITFSLLQAISNG